MKTSAELRARLDALRASITDLSALESITDEQDEQLSSELAEFANLEDVEIPKAEERERLMARVQGGQTKPQPADSGFQIMKPTSVDVTAQSSDRQVRDAAMKLLDRPDVVAPEAAERIERQMNRGETRNWSSRKFARRVAATEHPDYQTGFMKSVNGMPYAITDAERGALYNAASMTDTAGGFGVPVSIDPTIIITDGQTKTGIVSRCRVEAITNDEWKGVSGASTDWSFDGEAAQVSDDSSELAQPTVSAKKTQASIPYSIEVGMDYPGFVSEMGRLLRHGYTKQMASTLAVGSGGSNTPTGIFTALDANTNVEIDTDTTGALVGNDIDKVWAALPEDYRENATWFFSITVENAIRALSAGDNYNRFTVDQTSEGLLVLNGKPVVTSDYCPALDQTTAAENILVVGDFSNFVIAQRAGMNVETVQHKLGANGRPTGERILYAWARWGSDSVNDSAFRLLGDDGS